MAKENIHPAVIENIDLLAAAACIAEGGRRGGEYTPLSYKEDRDIWAGFLSDWTSDCRIAFLSALLRQGFKETNYEAPYFWKVTKGIVSVEYVEGDVYVSLVYNTVNGINYPVEQVA